MDKFDVIIIGSGPGGYVAAIRAAQLGLKTAIIEKDKELGGTCLNVGCIPSKALLASSDHFVFAKKEAAKHGIVLDKVSLDLTTMLGRKDKVVKTLTGGVRALMKGNKVTTFTGLGTITEPGKVRVQPNEGEATEIAADHIVIATGSVPINLPSMPFDGETVVSSTEALCFEKPPEKFLVDWRRRDRPRARLGLEPPGLRGDGARISAAHRRRLRPRSLESPAARPHRAGDEVSSRDQGWLGQSQRTAEPSPLPAKVVNELNFEADKVLVSVGRRAFAEGVGADKIGVALDERGRIKVDEMFRTNVPGVYAIGDVIAGPMLAHKAEEEGIACVELIAGKAGHVNYDVIPGIIYTNPELAGVGVTEDFAKEKGLKVRVGKFPFRANGRALANEDVEGLVKFVADAETDRILGASILSHAASELIAEIVAVMEFGGSSEDLGRTVHAHPTLSEAVKEAALAVEKHAIHIGNR